MFQRTLNLLLVVLMYGVLVKSYANPGACSGACWSHDPAVIQRTSDGVYFRFSTGGGIEITKATSISGPWTILGKALPSGSKINLAGNRDLWAPDVQKVGNLYHMYYSVSQFGSQNSAIGVATSSTMEVGSWTDHGSVGVASSSSKPYNAIDGNLINVSGTYYLTFGSFWHDIYQVKMAANALTKGDNAAYNIAYNSTGSSAQEAGYIFYNSGYYYLLISSGICCGYDKTFPAPGAEYQIMVCRSTSATGGFVDKNGKACTANGGSTLLKTHGNVYGPGGQGVFTDSKLGMVLYYHYADRSGAIGDGSKKFGWNALSWSNGWPVV